VVLEGAVIISASRRTDLPAFFAPWFAARVGAGWCEVANPFNPRQVSRLSLRPEDVDAIVFWTRHARPLVPFLPELDRLGFRYTFQYTITGYGRPIELRTPSVEVACRTFLDLAARLRPGSVVWRFDPLLVGDAFPARAHLARFHAIASRLEGHARRVVLSVVDPYRKTRRRLGRIFRWGEDLAEEPFAWAGIDDLLAGLAEAAREHGLVPEACAEARDLSPLGIAPTRCIDDRLLGDLFGGTWPSRKDPGQRPACRCIPSRDVGAPDTCGFGCRYCYATTSDEAARARRRRHDPLDPSLTGSPGAGYLGTSPPEPSRGR